MSHVLSFAFGLMIATIILGGLGFRAMYNGQVISLHQPHIEYQQADYVTQLSGRK